MNVQITVDGSCTPWKKGAIGIVVRDLDANEVVDKVHSDLAVRCTNNIAEYMAVIRACEYAIQRKHARPIIVTDSQLVFRQISGEYEVRKKELRGLHRAVMKLLKRVKATLRWHKRDDEDGPLADKLASYKWKEVIGGDNGDVRQERAGEDVEGLAKTAGAEALGELGQPHCVENKGRLQSGSQS